ncbi:MAG TPA: T9SS type A sorting domain-containing protein [Chitinophagaceae bacterium]|nr:T9SS type A sorting domain-containing protein [Chitinophagaceae bacterium]
MNSKSTLVGRYLIILTTFSLLLVFSSQAQTIAPKLRFIHPELVSGTAGQKHATYKFSNVVEGVDAFVKIAELKNGAKLVNIDDSTLGYYDAWQPTVGGPSTYGTSYIKWEIAFKTSTGADYTFPLMDLSAIDIDGDNVRVREFIDMEKTSSYDLPTMVPSLLSVSNINYNENEDDDDNGNNGNNDNSGNDGNELTKLHVLGPVLNRTGIDTVALDVRVNFHFVNISKIKLSLGSQIDNNGTPGGIATDRYSSLYFKSISNIVNTLGVKYRSLDAYAVNNTSANISWLTENETNNDHFEIERSFDQKNFSTVALIFAPEENTSGSNKYSYNDKTKDLNSHQVVYYRLKQIDIDGQITYSAVKIVRFNSANQTTVQVYPNPYLEKVNVNFSSDQNGNAELRMINLKGQVVASKKSVISKGTNNLQLTDLSSQATGLYVVEVIINGNLSTTQKLMKL